LISDGLQWFNSSLIWWLEKLYNIWSNPADIFPQCTPLHPAFQLTPALCFLQCGNWGIGARRGCVHRAVGIRRDQRQLDGAADHDQCLQNRLSLSCYSCDSLLSICPPRQKRQGRFASTRSGRRKSHGIIFEGSFFRDPSVQRKKQCKQLILDNPIITPTQSPHTVFIGEKWNRKSVNFSPPEMFFPNV